MIDMTDSKEIFTTQKTDLPEISIGMLGYAFMGKAHSNAYKKIPYIFNPPPAVPRLEMICGLPLANLAAAAQQYGFRTYTTDWHSLVENPNLQVIDNCGPNALHAPVSIAAVNAGKHILCEKPLALNAEEAKAMLDAATRAGVHHAAGFAYRFVPAICLARQLIQSGRLGKIYHYRAQYLQDWGLAAFNTPRTWKYSKKAAGSGATGDLGAHIIDMGRFLIGEFSSVQAITRTFLSSRTSEDGNHTADVDVDDAFAALAEFENGAIATLEATRFAAGRKNCQLIEINGEKGSLRFNLERINELEVYWTEDEPSSTHGFQTVLVTEMDHPWVKNWWPAGHVLGWEHIFVHEITHFLDCIVHDQRVDPEGATFRDGYRAAVVCDAILESAASRRVIDLKYEA
jgi:predicted dehydrogenase